VRQLKGQLDTLTAKLKNYTQTEVDLQNRLRESEDRIKDLQEKIFAKDERLNKVSDLQHKLDILTKSNANLLN
jgi:predicted  nucleic acid-binding Zn-ribbon protein